MFFTGLIAVGMLIYGAYQLIWVGLLYLGIRRDLYFQAEQTWVGMSRLGVSLMTGGGILLVTTNAINMGLPLAYNFCGLGWAVMWLLTPLAVQAIPPPWIRRLRHNHAHEIDLIRAYGQVMLQTRPDHFQRIIRNVDGWEAWLLTISRAMPLQALDEWQQRAEVAMENHLIPVAIQAAEQIIQQRPDQALGFHLRARALIADHRPLPALRDLDTCLHLQPSNADFYYQRARLRWLLGDTPGAQNDLDHALTLQPDATHLIALRETITP